MKYLWTLTLILSVSIAIAQHQPLKEVDPSTLKFREGLDSIKLDKRILTIKFSPDGNRVAIGGLDKKLAAFNVADATLAWRKEGPDYEPISSESVPSGNPLLIAAQNQWAGGKIKLIAWSTGEELGNLSPYAGGRGALDFFGDFATSKMAWGGPQGKVFEFDFKTNKIQTTTGWQHHEGKVYSLCYGPYGNLFTSGQDGKVVKNNQDEPVTEILAFDNPVLAMALNPYIKGTTGNKRFLAAGDNKGIFRILDLGTEEYIEWELGDEVKVIKFHTTDPDLVIAMTKRNLYFFDITKQEFIYQFDIDTDLWSMDISLDGTKIALGGEDGSIGIMEF